MSTDMFANSLWLVMALILVGSSLVLRRMPRGGLLKLALVWIGIFLAAWLVIRFATGLS